jgi:hypothetical protein
MSSAGVRVEVIDRLLARFAGRASFTVIAALVGDAIGDLADQPIEDQPELVERLAAWRIGDYLASAAVVAVNSPAR